MQWWHGASVSYHGHQSHQYVRPKCDVRPLRELGNEYGYVVCCFYVFFREEIKSRLTARIYRDNVRWLSAKLLMLMFEFCTTWLSSLVSKWCYSRIEGFNEYSLDRMMSANVEGRGIPMSCSSPPAEGRFSDSSITVVEETLNICRMTQSMIDIAANNLFGLRQYQTSGDLIQKEICECEVLCWILWKSLCSWKCFIEFLHK